jgi:hypothetical protein
MPIDIIHPHISHHDNYFIINNPTIYRTNLLQFLHSCISGSGVSKPTFQSQPALPLKTLTSPSSDIVLITTGPQAPNITLTPSKTVQGLVEENRQDRRFLRVPRVELRKVAREKDKEKTCERNFGCRCVRCGNRRVGRIAAIKRRRRVRREKDVEEGERSEVEG